VQQRISRSSVDAASVGAYDSPTASAAAAAAADGFKAAGLDGVDPLQQRAAGDDGPFAAAGLQGEGAQFSGHVAKAYAGPGAGPVDYGHVPAKGWYLHACVITAALGVRWWLLNQTDPLQRKVMLVIIWPVRVLRVLIRMCACEESQCEVGVCVCSTAGRGWLQLQWLPQQGLCMCDAKGINVAYALKDATFSPGSDRGMQCRSRGVGASLVAIIWAPRTW
jgi:hypothetical protein